MKIARNTASTYEKEHDGDCYMKAFLSNLDLRPSCYNCVNKTAKRECDITLADFWGIERVHPEIDAQPGVSLVLVQSEKGRKLLQDVAAEIQSTPTDAKQALQYNTAATASVAKQRGKRTAFFEEYQNGFEACVKKAHHISLYRRTRALLGKIKRRVIRIIKK